nr:transglycosylase SLT domain-containing protein [Sphingomonas bacterium]
MTARLIDAVARTARGGVRDAIARAADRTGVDFNYLLAQAQSESGLNPLAKAASSSAAGLYQFIDQSWLGVLKQHGTEHGYGWAADRIGWSHGKWRISDPAAAQAIFALRNDPEASALMAGEFASDNAAGLTQALGRPPRSADLYFAHFLGLKGASRFLKAADAYPDAAAASAFPREAAANHSIFYRKSGEPRSLSQVYALMARKIGGAGAVPSGDGFDRPVRMARADPDSVRLVDVPGSAAAKRAGGGDATLLALAERHGRINLLRPDPKHAMLAYRMIAASLT